MELESVRPAREDTRVLRRLLVVGLVSLCLAAPAQAGTVAIFYYAWYGTPARDGVWQHWDQNGHRPPADVYSRYYPARGAYSSSDPAVVNAQMAEIAAAGVDEVIVSWWGRDSAEDKRLPMVLAAARRHGLQPAIHLEPYAGRSTVTIAQDAAYLASLGIRDVYVYHPADIAAADWAALRPQLPPSLRLFAGTQLVGFAAAGRFDGFYTYDFINFGGAKFSRLCAQAHAMHILCAPSVGPGYDGLRAGEFSLLEPAEQRPDVRQPLEGGDRRPSGHDHDHVVQRVGRGHADRAGAGETRLRHVRGRLGADRRRGVDGLSDAHDVLGRTLPRLAVTVSLCTWPPAQCPLRWPSCRMR